jgi:GT2 family glycosyltransferase
MTSTRNIAVLLTCHNRKPKTLQCLSSFYASSFPENFVFDIYLVDDASSDGTSEAIREQFPQITIISGNGNLFWAGGMRLAFEHAQKAGGYDGYLLLNDDVELQPDFFAKILATQKFCTETLHLGGLYSGSTFDKKKGVVSYGASLLFKGIDNPAFQIVTPKDEPQACHLTNANVLYVEKSVIEKIGFLDKTFIHGIADFDFSLRAIKAGFPVYITPGFCGYCEDDHGNNWSESKSLKQRIQYLKSPLGLSYTEYLFYIKRHYPSHLWMSIFKLWFKTIAPSFYVFLIKKY